SGLGGQWTYEQLDRFLTAPARAVPGTKMGFAGIRNPRERAHVIAFLATLGSSKLPLPLPKVAASAPPQTAAKANVTS
ncbi:MAG TPA: cytochrome c family protein, partial [Sphingomonas sp.]|nr:cytochrome c family protein [Sphingomonas sp.]